MAKATGKGLEKAMIQVLKANGEKQIEVPVKFNPSEYTMEKSNEFANINIPGLESPILQFTRGGLGTLSMDLFFDSYEEGKDVRCFTDRITDLLKIDKHIHAPPVLKFVWGSLLFTCVLTKVSKKFTMFRHDGIPVRATLSVTFSEFPTEVEKKAEPCESSDRTKVYTIKRGDSLWEIAAREYGDPGLWRHIADKNSIENPRILEAGRAITIPPIEK